MGRLLSVMPRRQLRVRPGTAALLRCLSCGVCFLSFSCPAPALLFEVRSCWLAGVCQAGNLDGGSGPAYTRAPSGNSAPAHSVPDAATALPEAQEQISQTRPTQMAPAPDYQKYSGGFAPAVAASEAEPQAGRRLDGLKRSFAMPHAVCKVCSAVPCAFLQVAPASSAQGIYKPSCLFWQMWNVSEPPPQRAAAPSGTPPLPIIKRGTRGLPSQQSKKQARARALHESPMTKAGGRFKLEKKQAAMVSQTSRWG